MSLIQAFLIDNFNFKEVTKIMLHVCTDQGASCTRYSANNSKVYKNPNNFITVEPDEDIRYIPHSDEFVDNMDLTITKDGDSDFFPKRILGGTLADRYSSSSVKPSMLSSKSKQPVNYYSIISSVVDSILLKEGSLNGENPVEVACYICLPPVEITGNNENEDYVKAQLKGKYTVKLNKMDKEITFNIREVSIYPESVMAVVAFLFNQDATQRTEMAKYNKGNVLSFDIGASTSDLVIINDRKFVEHSGYTCKLGGNIIDDLLRNEIRRKLGVEVSNDDIAEAVRTGRLAYGSSYKDVSEELKKCKKQFAKMLFEKIQNYFATNGMGLQSIKAIFMSGGGSMPSSYIDESGKEIVTSPSVGEYIDEEIKKVCDSIDMVLSPSVNPRECNIVGLILSMNVQRKQSQIQSNKSKKE